MDLFGFAEEVDMFEYITNSELSWEEMGISFSFENCEWTSKQSGKIGGGHGSGSANFNWTMTLDCNYWFKGYENVEIEATFDVNAPCVYNYAYEGFSNGYGSIGVFPKEGDAVWVDSPSWRYSGPYEAGMRYDPYWGKTNASMNCSPSKVSTIQFKGIGYDADYVSGEVFLSEVIFRFPR